MAAQAVSGSDEPAITGFMLVRECAVAWRALARTWGAPQGPASEAPCGVPPVRVISGKPPRRVFAERAYGTLTTRELHEHAMTLTWLETRRMKNDCSQEIFVADTGHSA